MSSKKPIHEAISDVLLLRTSMTGEEIFEQIQNRHLYDFHAKNPLHVVHTQLRRHCKDLDFPSAKATKYFALDRNGKYSLLTKPVRVEPRVYKVKPGRNQKRDAIVTVPTEEPWDNDIPDSGGHTHTEIQFRLLDLGRQLGMSVWAPMNDRGRSWNGRKIASINKLASSLPRQFDPGTMKTIEYIDVIWLEHQAIAAAFEIEHTTPIYSGLLRMSDLLTMQPNLDIKWYLVAPDNRFDKFANEIGRPTFGALRKPLYKVCRFLSYSKLLCCLNDTKGYHQHLKPTVLDDIAEAYDPAEAFDD